MYQRVERGQLLLRICRGAESNDSIRLTRKKATFANRFPVLRRLTTAVQLWYGLKPPLHRLKVDRCFIASTQYSIAEQPIKLLIAEYNGTWWLLSWTGEATQLYSDDLQREPLSSEPRQYASFKIMMFELKWANWRLVKFGFQRHGRHRPVEYCSETFRQITELDD